MTMRRRLVVTCALPGLVAACVALAWSMWADRGFTLVDIAAVCALLFGIPSTALVLLACALTTKPAAVPLRSVAAGGLAACVVFAGSTLFIASWIRSARAQSWRRDAEALVPVLEAHRRVNGGFPEEIETLGRAAPRPPSRWFSYVGRGDSFEMTVHNPASFLGWDGWTYTSERRTWEYYWD